MTPVRLHRQIRSAFAASLAVAALLCGCSTSVVVKARQRDMLTHALFIENKGVPAKLVDSLRSQLPPRDQSCSPYDFPDAVFAPQISPHLPGYGKGFGKRIEVIADSLEAHIRRHHEAEVMLILHGGRNTLAESMDEEMFVLQRIKATRPDVYPIFIKYESEDLSSYFEHLVYTVPDDREWYEKGWRLLRFPGAMIVDAAQGGSRLPLNVYQEASREWSILRESELKVEGGIPDTLLGHFQVPHGRQPLGFRVMRFVLGMAAIPPRAVVDVVIAALGPGEWESMKRRSQVMLILDQNYIPDVHSTTDCRKALSSEPSGSDGRDVVGAVGQLLRMLQVMSIKHSQLTVSMIAHSTGAIVACNIVHESRKWKVRWKDIVFMAAACTVDDFDTKVRPMIEHPDAWWPGNNARSDARGGNGAPLPHFYNLSLHPSAELQEYRYPVALLVRGTLLVWIDDFLAPLGTFKTRTLGRAENAARYMGTLPAETLSRCYLKVFAYEKDAKGSATPMSHGGFLNPSWCYWERPFWSPDSSQAAHPAEPVPTAQTTASP